MFAASKSGRAGASTDPFFPYVPLLLETTSTNGQQNNTFLDSSTNNFTITRNGTPTQGSITPYWPNGYWGNYFNGSSDYLTTPANTAFAFGTGDFTVELWFYKTATADGAVNDYASANGFGFVIQNNNVQTFASTQPAINFAATINLNQWNHVAVVRNSGTLYCYLNGVSIGTPTADSKNYLSPSSLTIGRNAGGTTQYFPGYMSNLRLVKGTAVYTGAFTPPTTPLTAITNTSLLTCQSNRFRDNSTNNFTLTANGTPRVQAFQPFSPVASYTTAAYGGSGYFNGSTDYLSNASISALTFGTADFTVEYWVYCPALPGLSFICAGNGASSTDIVFGFQTSSAPYCSSSVNFPVYTNTVVPINAWTHIAFVRASGTWKLWMNGVDVTVGSQSNPNVTTSTLGIGAASGGSGRFTGYISNLRVVKGTAVYTGAFTPPTLAPLTTAGSTSAASYSSTTNVNTSFASSATSLLTNFTNAGIYDAAVQNNAITVGDAQSSTTQFKWSPTSMKFDGTGDYLQSPFQTQFQFGSGNFTIDFWVYFNSVASGQRIAGQDNSASNVTWAIYTTTSGRLDYYLSSTGSAWNIASGVSMGSIATGTWYYVALVRNGSTFTPYINSVAGTTTTSSAALFASTAPLTIGADAGGPTSYLNGYIQDFRITKYARTITTPTAAFPTR